jgi:hypothetical protein
VFKTQDGTAVPVFLCTWHATKCWLEQLHNKLVDKSRVTETFNAIHDIMLLKVAGTPEEKLAAVDAAIKAFKEAFSDEGAVLQWFEREWEVKSGRVPESYVCL